jgi:hypothetical protein
MPEFRPSVLISLHTDYVSIPGQVIFLSDNFGFPLPLRLIIPPCSITGAQRGGSVNSRIRLLPEIFLLKLKKQGIY